MQTFKSNDLCFCEHLKNYKTRNQIRNQIRFCNIVNCKCEDIKQKPKKIKNKRSNYVYFRRYYFHHLYCNSHKNNYALKECLTFEICKMIAERAASWYLLEHLLNTEMYFLQHTIIHKCFKAAPEPLAIYKKNMKWIVVKRSQLIKILQTYLHFNTLYLTCDDMEVSLTNLQHWLSLVWDQIIKEIIIQNDNPIIELFDYSIKINGREFSGAPFVSHCLHLFQSLDDFHAGNDTVIM